MFIIQAVGWEELHLLLFFRVVFRIESREKLFTQNETSCWCSQLFHFLPFIHLFLETKEQKLTFSQKPCCCFLIFAVQLLFHFVYLMASFLLWICQRYMLFNTCVQISGSITMCLVTLFVKYTITLICKEVGAIKVKKRCPYSTPQASKHSSTKPIVK